MTIRLAIAFIFMFSAGPSFAADVGPCEKIVAPAFERESFEEQYIRLTLSELARGPVTKEDLKWAIGQPQPVNLVRLPRNPRRRPIFEAYAALIPQMNRALWPAVVQELRQILIGLNKQASHVAEAREETRPIFAVLPDRKLAERLNDHLLQFISSKGEIFFAAKVVLPGAASVETYVYNFSKGDRFLVNNRHANRSNVGFYETKSGEVIFAVAAEGKLNVVNARTGVPLRQKDVQTNGPHNEPLVFEDQGRLKVVIAPGAMDRVVNSDGTMSVPIVDVDSGDIAWDKIRAGMIQTSFARLSNGHVYGYSYLWNQDKDSGRILEKTLILRDFSTGSDIINTQVDDPWFSGNESPRLINGKVPYIAFYASSGNWMAFNPRTKALEPMHGTQDLNDMNVFLDDSGEAWIAGTKYFNGRYRLAVTRLRSNSSLEIEFQTEGHRSIRKLETVHTPQGTLILGWESDSAKLSGVHLYNLSDKGLLRLDIPGAFKMNEERPTFFSTLEGNRLLNFAWVGPRQWRLMQLYGPELQR